nr:uncharacterized protein LOC117281987 [Nicotiana tomentosiformis]
MEKDVKDFVQKCDKCQRHAPMIYQQGELLHLVLSSWLFMKWGMDIVGPLPWVPGKAHYILLMTDYFSKWVEAQAFEKVKEKEVEEILPKVLWTYQSTSKSSTSEIPFSLVYGAEALIPVEVREPSLRFQYASKISNDEAMATILDLADEQREATLAWLAAQKQQIGKDHTESLV